MSLAGVCDLAWAFAEAIGDDAAAEFIGPGPPRGPRRTALAGSHGADPGRSAGPARHGDADDRVPVEHSRRLRAGRCGRAGDEGCELLELPGVDHFAVYRPRTPRGRPIAARLEALR